MIEPILPYTDFIVGNSMDVQSLAEELRWQEKRLDEIALSYGSTSFFIENELKIANHEIGCLKSEKLRVTTKLSL